MIGRGKSSAAKVGELARGLGVSRWRCTNWHSNLEGTAVLVERGLVGRVGKAISLLHPSSPTKVAVVTASPLLGIAERVARSVEGAGHLLLHGIGVPDGEAAKTLDSVRDLWRLFARVGLDRHSVVVAVGGGTVTDVVGYAASSYLRGIRWVAVPTTLLGMVDASIGGKTGVDLEVVDYSGRPWFVQPGEVPVPVQKTTRRIKNAVGAFHAPAAAILDPDLLGALLAPGALEAGLLRGGGCPEVLAGGLAETIKHGLLAGGELWDRLARGPVDVDEDLVERSAAVKVEVVNRDPWEQLGGERETLNLGHTVAHAIEAASGFRVPHGTALVAGLLAEADLAQRVQVGVPGIFDETSAVLERWSLGPSWGLARALESVRLPEVLLAIADDKKRRGSTVRFVLPATVGRAAPWECCVDEVCNVVAPSVERALGRTL